MLAVAHRPPDADGVGSLLALTRALRALGKHVDPVCVEALEPGLASLPGAGDVRAGLPARARWDVAVLLDCATLERAGLADDVLARAGGILNVDHHVTNPGFGDLALVDPMAPATAALVVDLFDALGVALAPGDATCLYAGLLTDTERFTADGVTDRTHLLAARLLAAGANATGVATAMYATRPLGTVRLVARALTVLRTSAGGRVAWIELRPRDFERAGVDPVGSEDLAPLALGVEGVWTAAYLRPTADGQVRAGLRSRHPCVDVSAVASAFGGGGHRHAAGCVLPPGRAGVRRIVAALEEAVARDQF